MYALQDYIGEEAVSRALTDLTKTYAFKGPPYPTSLDLMAALKKVTPSEFQYLFEDLFENITIYDNRTRTATATKQPDGNDQVHLSVEAMKYQADGRGQEHQVPVHDLMAIGVVDKDGHFLYLQRQRMDQEKAEFDVTVDKRPAKAGIDQLIKLIDRNPDDNVIAVETRWPGGEWGASDWHPRPRRDTTSRRWMTRGLFQTRTPSFGAANRFSPCSGSGFGTVARLRHCVHQGLLSLDEALHTGAGPIRKGRNGEGLQDFHRPACSLQICVHLAAGHVHQPLLSFDK
jgi:hypothetical protein